jgi:hypothetical protein
MTMPDNSKIDGGAGNYVRLGCVSGGLRKLVDDFKPFAD